MASTLYCPYCNKEFEGQFYQETKVKVHNHIRRVCKMAPKTGKAHI